MSITNTDAARLTRDEIRSIVNFCNWQRESLWDDLDLQGILDAYHASKVWDGIEAWLSIENTNHRRALKRWRAIHAAAYARANPTEGAARELLYNHDGLAGCVARAQRREAPRVLVGIYNAVQAGIDVGADTWAVVCEAHGSILGVGTLALARSSRNTSEWCAGCVNEDGEESYIDGRTV